MQYKHNYDKALFRYTQIIAKLYKGKQLSNVELSKEFQVSTKTIQRDFAKLVLMFPIFQEKKLWQLEEDFEFKENLSLEDDITLKLLLQASKSFDASFSSRADKLLSRINDNINSPIYIKKYFMRKPISKSQRLKEFDEDDNMIITLDITNENEIIPIVKYWLPNIKVLKPIGLNEKIEDEVREFLTN